MAYLSLRRIIILGVILALLAPGLAEAQRFDRARQAEARREAMQQRLQQMDRAALQERIAQRDARRAERANEREDAGERLSLQDPQDVRERLDATEIELLERLAEADPDAIEQILESAGVETADPLVTAALYAEAITPEIVAGLIEQEAFLAGLENLGRDPEAIAARLNAIGEKALES